MSKVVLGRSRLGLPPLPSGSVSTMRLFGLQDAMVTRLVEQLPKAENCSSYNFKYFKPSKMSQWERVKKVGVECRGTTHTTLLKEYVKVQTPLFQG